MFLGTSTLSENLNHNRVSANYRFFLVFAGLFLGYAQFLSQILWNINVVSQMPHRCIAPYSNNKNENSQKDGVFFLLLSILTI